MRQKFADFLVVSGEILERVIDAFPHDDLPSREHIAQLRCDSVNMLGRTPSWPSRKFIAAKFLSTIQALILSSIYLGLHLFYMS